MKHFFLSIQYYNLDAVDKAIIGGQLVNTMQNKHNILKNTRRTLSKADNFIVDCSYCNQGVYSFVTYLLFKVLNV